MGPFFYLCKKSIMPFLFIGTPELFIVILLIVLLFGAKKIPELARGLGKGMREFKNATGDIQEEIRKTSAEIKQSANITDSDKGASSKSRKS